MRWLRRFGLGLLIALLSVNLWTGCPLLAVWLGSRVEASTGSLSMGAVVIVVAVLATLSIFIVWALAQLGAAYDHVTGRPPAPRRQAAWLRSLSGERSEYSRRRHPATALEKVLTASVVLAVMGLEFWFFFFSGSPIGHS